jgi:hypothetical protein
MGTRRVYDNEVEFIERTDIDMEYDENSEEYFKVIEDEPIVVKQGVNQFDFNSKVFAYPGFIKEKIIYAEDIQEAVIQHLVKAGVATYDELTPCYFEFEDPDTGKFVTTQVLKIRWR